MQNNKLALTLAAIMVVSSIGMATHVGGYLWVSAATLVILLPLSFRASYLWFRH